MLRPVHLFVASAIYFNCGGASRSPTGQYSLAGNCSCPLSINPVCATRGPTQYTYMNRCVLNCTQTMKPELEYLYDGACCRLGLCTPFDSPVCDHRGQIYASECLFEYAQCVELRQGGRHLAMDMTSPACVCARYCNSQWDPVCDADGNTHGNLCSFMNARCLARVQYDRNLELDYLGSCCENLCVSSYLQYPVCDSDNVTHPDICSFYKQRCRLARRYTQRSKLTIKSLGPCPNKNKNSLGYAEFLNKV